VLLTRTLVQGPGQGQGLESEGQAPRQWLWWKLVTTYVNRNGQNTRFL